MRTCTLNILNLKFIRFAKIEMFKFENIVNQELNHMMLRLTRFVEDRQA